MALRFVIAVALAGTGWAVGRAQARVGDFELAIDAVVGTTTVECIRGCSLLGNRDLTLVAKQPKATYTFGCSGPGQERCAARVSGFLSPGSSTQANAEQEIEKLTTQYEYGIRLREASVHERLFAADYTYTPGNGNFMNRASHIAFTTSGTASVGTLLSEDRLVRLYGDTAVVTGRWVFTGNRGEQAVSRQGIRYLLVFAKRDGRWQIVAEQRTPLAPSR